MICSPVMDAAFEGFLHPEDMFLDPNNNSNQDVIMKSKGKKNSLRLQSMINRCKLLSLSDSDEEHKNKEEKSPSTSKSSTNPLAGGGNSSSVGNSSGSGTKSRAPTHGHHIRTRNNRSPYSHKLLSGKRNRNCWSDIERQQSSIPSTSKGITNGSNNNNSSSNTNTNNSSNSTTSTSNGSNTSKQQRYPQRMDCQNISTTEEPRHSMKKTDVSQDFYGDDEASDFFDSSLSSINSSRVRRVKVRHFRTPNTCPKYDLNTQSLCKRRKVK